MRELPQSVHRPVRTDEVAPLLAAVPDGVDVRPRGRAHSVDGQAVTSGHLVDFAGMREVAAPHQGSIRAEAGATWRDVIDRCASHGLAPPVVVDHLDLTVGGTLSMGGISGTTHLFGTQADHVIRATVADRRGCVHTLRRGDRLLDLTLCAQGRSGIILDVDLRLIPAPALIRRWTLQFQTVQDLVAAQARLVQARARVHVDGRGAPVGPGEWKWTATVAADATDTATIGALATQLHHDTVHVETQEQSLPHFLDRAGAALRADHQHGTWRTYAHPRTQLIVPLTPGVNLVDTWTKDPEALDGLGPGGSILLYTTPARRLRRLRAAGDHDGLSLVIGWQRTIDPHDALALTRARAHSDAMRDAARKVGGTAYAGPPITTSLPTPASGQY